MKIVSSILLVVFMLMSCAVRSDEGLVDVRAQGSGNTREQALMNAVNEALRKSMGTMILSREEINNDALTERVIQVSRGSIKHSRVLSEMSEAGRIVLDVRFSIDPSEIREAMRSVKPETLSTSAADIVSRPFLGKGRKIIRAFFEGIDLAKFLEVRLSGIRIDPDKEEFSATITLTMNTEKFRLQFAEPMTAILDEAVLKPELGAELSGEEEQIREAGIIYLLEQNKSFRAWTIPLAFLEELKSAAGIDDFSERNVLQTHKRIWVNISLNDQRGRELQYHRLPVMLPVTNIIMFSVHDQTPPLPLVFAGSVRPKSGIICAPLFGIRDNSGRRYTSIFSDDIDPLNLKFTVHLPRATLSRITNASSWLQAERH